MLGIAATLCLAVSEFQQIPYIIFTLRMLCYFFFVWIALGVGIMGKPPESGGDMQQLYTWFAHSLWWLFQ